MHNKLNFDLAQFTTKDPSRYQLDCLQVNPTNTVVTNGHYVIRVSTTPQEVEGFPAIEGETVLSEFEPFLLPGDACKQVSKAIPRSKTFAQIEHAAICKNGTEKARIAVTDLDTVTILEPRKMEGQFPNWEQIIPVEDEDNQPVLTIGFDPNYIAKIAAYAAKFGKTLKFTFYDPNKPAKLEVNGETQSMFALLMPMRLADGD